MVSEFYRKGSVRKTDMQLVSTWLGTLKHFDEMSKGFLEKVALKFQHVTLNNKYRKSYFAVPV